MLVESLGWEGIGEQAAYLSLAVPIDYNGDGRQDLLMPVPPGLLASGIGAELTWGVLLARGEPEGPTFSLVDPHIPFEASFGETIHLADPHGPRVGDLNGDGAPDVVLSLGGVFNISRAAPRIRTS